MLAEVDLTTSTSVAPILERQPETTQRHVPYYQDYWSIELSSGRSSGATSVAGFLEGIGVQVSLAAVSPSVTGSTVSFTPSIKILIEAEIDGFGHYRSHISELWLNDLPEVPVHAPEDGLGRVFGSRATVLGSLLPAASGKVQNEALRLSQISGLGPPQLAQALGVTKQAYYDWLNGKSTSSTHKVRLLEVLTLMEEASARLGSPDAVNIWLLKPVAPGEDSPIKLLADHRDNLFRGALLQSKAQGRAARLLGSRPRHKKSRTDDEIRQVGRQWRRAARLEEDE